MATPTSPTPVINTDAPARAWYIADIYDPANTAQTGQYVPNVNDLVWDYDEGWMRVTAVDYTTGISTRSIWNLPQQPSEAANGDDVLLGAGPGTVADSYRALIDYSVHPAILSLDHRLHYYGTTTTSIKVFVGTDISYTGQVISQYYDQNWNLLGENIPLELASIDANNIATKAPKVGYTTASLTDGELLTVVAYDDVGNVVSTAKVVAQLSTFVRQADAASKYISAISLESPFLSQADNQTVQYPVNMPVAGLNLMGRVSYSDGSSTRLPVDGTKFSLYGLEQYIATQPGQTLPLVLSYLLSQGESNYIGSPSNNARITRQYNAKTLPMDGAFTIKLFVIPVWQNVLQGYRLQYFLYNLDRTSVYDVSAYVEAAANSVGFNPTLYGTAQNLAVAVSMDQVDPSYPPFRYVQPFTVTLLKAGNSTGAGDAWSVLYSPSQPAPYGVGVFAVSNYLEVGNWTLDLTCGLTDFNTWINQVYYAAMPLYDSQSEVMAPVPNIMAVYINNTRYEFPIDQWNTLLTVTTAVPQGSAIYLEWVLRNGTDDLQLA